MLRFTNRNQAGRLLGAALREYGGRCDVAVVPVHDRATDVAEKVASVLGAVYATAAEELPDIVGATVILVDDGFDSSARIYEASLVARDRGASIIVAGAPVGMRGVWHQIDAMVDRSFCLGTPTPFQSTGFWYEDTMQFAAQLLFSTPPPSFTLTRRSRARGLNA
jgi:predicted phosphoribosyltransferase